MDIQQRGNILGQNGMHIENVDPNKPQFIFNQGMEMENIEFDKFDELNKHDPQMVSTYAKNIFDYLRTIEVTYFPFLGFSLRRIGYYRNYSRR